jgi:hypothetical protein
VNLGGEPERDDSGLPPVDIDVPDDARELDRDVQAYRREQRALRRQERRMRIRGPLTRDGVVLPLLASCLVLALIAGTLLTVFTAGPGGDLTGAGLASRPPASGSTSAPASSTASPASAAPSAGDSLTATPSGRKLPDRDITIAGTPVLLSSLVPSVFALVPARCRCMATVRKLVSQAKAAGLNTYLVGGAGLVPFRQLKAQPRHGGILADDASGVLAAAFRHRGLTALLVHPDGAVSVAAPLPPGFTLTHQLQRIHAEWDGAQVRPTSSSSASRPSTSGSPAAGTPASATTAPATAAPATSPAGQ